MPQQYIVTARERFHVADADEYHEQIIGPPTRELPRGWRRLEAGQEPAPGLERRPADHRPLADPAVAYVNHGRWVADCPAFGCNGAMLLLEGAPYLCGTCFNADIGGDYRPVTWPEAASRAAIEAALIPRPLAELMNWRPGESVIALEIETATMPQPGA